MKRFYYNRSGDIYLIFDAARSNTVPFAQCDDVTTAEMVVKALNKYSEALNAT